GAASSPYLFSCHQLQSHSRLARRSKSSQPSRTRRAISSSPKKERPRVRLPIRRPSSLSRLPGAIAARQDESTFSEGYTGTGWKASSRDLQSQEVPAFRQDSTTDSRNPNDEV